MVRQCRRWWGIVAVVMMGWLLAACDEAAPAVESNLPVANPTATLRPTPTLVPALAAVEPSPIPTATGENPVVVPTATPIVVVTAISEPTTIGVATKTGETAVSPTPTSLLVVDATEAPTTTPTPFPTPILSAAELLALAPVDIEHGDLEAAALKLEGALSVSTSLTAEQVREAQYLLGKVYVQDGRFGDAIPHLTRLLDNDPAVVPSGAHFQLGQAQAGVGNGAAAIAAYEQYLQLEPEMGAYVYPLIGDLLSGAEAIDAYEAAVVSPAHRLHLIGLRRTLANWHRAEANYTAVIAQYDAIRDLAVTEYTQGEVSYLAGSAALQAGDVTTAYARYQEALTEYPRAYETYLGLVELVEAGVAVDDYQRGVIDYYAGAYEPGVIVLERFISANGRDAQPDATLYLAWSYEGLGNINAALDALDGYARVRPADAVIERAKLYARIGDTASAVENYIRYLEAFPDGPDAPFAAWWASTLAVQLGEVETAVVRYRELALAFPWHEDADEALFEAGWLAYWYDEPEMAAVSWLQAAEEHGQSRYGAASLLWLQRTAPELQVLAEQQAEAAVSIVTTPTVSATAELTPTIPVTVTATPAPSLVDWGALLTETARLAEAAGESLTAVPWDYYGFRLYDIANEIPPFTTQGNFIVPTDEAVAQAEAEVWLRQRLGLAEGADVQRLDTVLTEDSRYRLGNKLWELGLHELAKRELESLRADYARSPLFSYQLALYFRDIGLYRSSILAANAAMFQLGETAFTAPRFIARLAYPVYYNDLVLPLAEQYGYDVRLHFSLIRQESLFESFARSGAAAQGLSQVIPATGEYIALKLAWAGFENDDLYRPDVGLTFGAFYLDEQLANFEGQAHAALSAYNAGPGNAARWYGTAGKDQDLYVETVDFSETRLYIERIYMGYVVYRYLYG